MADPARRHEYQAGSGIPMRGIRSRLKQGTQLSGAAFSERIDDSFIMVACRITPTKHRLKVSMRIARYG